MKGYIYIFINPSQKNNLKIGRTSSDTDKRREQLKSASKTSTGVMTDFILAYEHYVENAQEVEKLIHQKLQKYRINKKKEFFILPLNKAITTLIQIIDELGTQIHIKNTDEIKGSFEEFWNELSFQWKVFIKQQLELDWEFTKKELIEAARNIIDFSKNKNERKFITDLYQEIDYQKNIKKWYEKLPKSKKNTLRSYSNRQLTKTETNEIKNLTTLNCSSEKFIYNLEPIIFLTKLISLNLSQSNISDLSGIENLVNLEKLYLLNTKIKNIQPLTKLKKLKEIHCYGTLISKESIDLFSEINPKCKIVEDSFLQNIFSGRKK